jgi:microcystin-dependent protein
MVGFNFAPQGWAFCNGALLSIAQNDVLFNLIGTTYGGDGQSTFALPDLQGRRVVHQGAGYPMGAIGGQETVTLFSGTVPSHNHQAMASSHPGTTTSPAGAVWAAGTGSTRPYTPAAATTPMLAGIVSTTGGGQPHENMPPFLAMNFVISLFGVYPTPT